MCSKTKVILLSIVLIGLAGGTVFAAGGYEVDSGVLLKDFLYRLLNFSLLVALLAFFLRKPIKKGFVGRRVEIEKALAEAQRIEEEAEAKFAEYDRKLDQAAAEIAEIAAAIRREGELEKQKIVKNAQAMAVKIEQEAEKAAELEVSKARTALQREAVILAVGVAEELLQKNFTRDDDTRLIDEYMQKVGELH